MSFRPKDEYWVVSGEPAPVKGVEPVPKSHTGLAVTVV